MIKASFGILLGAVLAFMWSSISWMVLPYHGSTLNQFNEPEKIGALIKENIDHAGVYVFPKGEDMEDKKKGPTMFAVIRPGERSNFTMNKLVLRGFLATLVSSLILGIMLSAAAPRLNYIGRVMFVLMGGLFAGLAAAYPNCIWWEFPTDFVGLSIIDLVVSWGLAGLAMAGLINGK